ncbi:hypothetical protein N665_0026s0064 [Sinapis alba]|nr:hypothetical protein N665_0026s0064 [Sinapis alba]
MRLGYLPIFSRFIEGRKYSSATRASLARLVLDLEKFENYPWGRVAFKVLMDSLRAKDFTKSYTVDGFIKILHMWIYHALPELGANYGNPLPNKSSPPLLAFKGGKGRKCFKDAISKQTRVINYVEKNIEEIFPKWDNDREDVFAENIIQVMFNAPPNWKWTMNCWKDEGIYPWTNPKMHVVYVKEESSVKSLIVREEDIERPSKRARTETPAEPRSEDIPDARSGAIPDARSEASIHVSGVEKAYIEKCFKDLTYVMRDGFGTCLKEMKLLGNMMDVVEKKLGITGKGTSSDDLQHTTSSLPKRVLEHGSESVNEANELKEKATKGLEKTLAKAKKAKTNEARANKAKANAAKAKEAKAKEAKAKEAKAKEAKAKEAKAKEAKAKEKEEKEAKLAAEAWLRDAKLEEEAKAKEATDKVLSTEPEASAEASVVLMDKDKDTVSDVKMQEAMRLSKKDSALAAIRGRSERDRKLAASQQSPFQGNSTAKLIIPNTKVGHGYDHFALPDKQLSKVLMEHLKKDFRLNIRLSRRLTGIVPTFFTTNKTWGIDIDDIYAPVNFQNDHWIAIWISIPKRHIVVWDNIMKHISKAQLDEVMESFLTMVPYLLVEYASTDEERIKYSLEPFTYEKPTVGVPQ